MPPRRVRTLSGPKVTLVVDGRDVEATLGEPIASALVASGRWVFGRSVKYHRARGPTCFAGRCEGCLLRIDGVSSVMSCRTPARHGTRCDSQNVMGSAESDLLAITDFMFPAGLDHHEMFTWNEPVNRVMQLVAREIAGVGVLPDAPEASRPVERRDVAVLVIGAGLAGLTVAAATQRAGLSTLVLDAEPTVAPHLTVLSRSATDAGAELRLGIAALGVFTETDGRRIVLGDGTSGDGALTVHPRAIVCAMGRAETGAAFEGNDLPGIVSAGGAERLLAQGILVGDEVVLAANAHEHDAAARLASRLRESGARVTEIREDEIVRARGRSGVRAVETKNGTLDCDALVVASRRAPISELAQQAGAKVAFDGEVFAIEADEDGRTAHPRTFVAGSAVRDGADAEVALHAGRVAAAVIEAARG